LNDSLCKKISLIASDDPSSCLIDINGEERASKVENAIQIIKYKLEGIVSKEELRKIKAERSYEWCKFHNCFGHDTKDCRKRLKLGEKKRYEFEIRY
jgi:hypothetical protein